MGEMLDIYNKDREKTSKTVERNKYKFLSGEYVIVVTGVIINSKNELLITKRAPHKKYGLMWEFTSGTVLSGETSLEGIIRELKEEIGITFTKKEAIYLKEIRKDDVPADFKDIWILKKDIEIKDLKFTDGEVIDAKWVDICEFMEMINKKEIVPTIDFGIDEYNQALQIKQRNI